MTISFANIPPVVPVDRKDLSGICPVPLIPICSPSTLRVEGHEGARLLNAIAAGLLLVVEDQDAVMEVLFQSLDQRVVS